VSVRLATLAQARLRRRLLAYARERLCTHGEKRTESHAQRGPHGQLNRTKTTSVDGLAAGRQTSEFTIRPGAFRGMAIWEIRVKRKIAEHWPAGPGG